MFVVYRIFDAWGDLLYVGCTENYPRRLSQHRHSAEWYEEMAYRKLKYYSSREYAEAVEARAIWMLQPEYNVTHQKDERERRLRLNGSFLAMVANR